MALRKAIAKTLAEANLTIANVSNYNMSRAAGSKVFSMVIYNNTKAERGTKQNVKLVLDKEVSTLVVAINVIEAMIEEEANKNFLHKAKTETKTTITAETGKGW